MLPLSIGIVIALGFASLVGSIYGVEQLVQGAWPMLVVWGLIAGPALMSFAGQGSRRS
jgi:hypothetical protein